VPFAFTGKLNKITLMIDRPKLAPEDEKKRVETRRNATSRPVATLIVLSFACKGEV